MKTLVDSLGEQISAATSVATRDELRCQRAIYFARIGRLAESTAERDLLRAEHSKALPPRLTIMVQILEGLLSYFTDGNLNGIDRINRAVAISNALDEPDLRSLSASWQAHFAFNSGNISLMGDALVAYLRTCERADSSTRARVCLLLADAYQVVGNWKMSSAWYIVARQNAREALDRASLASIEFNRLGFGISRLRIEIALSGTAPKTDVSRSWLTEIESVRGLHAGLDDESLPELLTLCNARCHQFVGKFPEASELFRQLRSEHAFRVCRLNSTVFEIESSWCELKAGNALTLRFSDLNLNALDLVDVDDQVVLWTMILDMFGSQDTLSRTQIEAKRTISIDRYNAETDSIRFQLKRLMAEARVRKDQTGIDLMSELRFASGDI